MKSGARTIKHIYFVSLDIYLHSSTVPQLDLNLHSNPYDDKLISVFLEGGKRTLSKPIIKKDPITPDILSKIIDIYGKDHSNLKNVRLCANVYQFVNIFRLKITNSSENEILTIVP
jgi:hypothetical protein